MLNGTHKRVAVLQLIDVMIRLCLVSQLIYSKEQMTEALFAMDNGL